MTVAISGSSVASTSTTSAAPSATKAAVLLFSVSAAPTSVALMDIVMFSFHVILVIVLVLVII